MTSTSTYNISKNRQAISFDNNTQIFICFFFFSSKTLLYIPLEKHHKKSSLWLKNRKITSKDYIRKVDADDRSQRKLKFAHLSASAGNFRAKEEDKYAGGIEMKNSNNLQNSATSSNK